MTFSRDILHEDKIYITDKVWKQLKSKGYNDLTSTWLCERGKEVHAIINEIDNPNTVKVEGEILTMETYIVDSPELTDQIKLLEDLGFKIYDLTSTKGKEIILSKYIQDKKAYIRPV